MASDINYASWPRHVARHIDVGDQKQLFLDDGFLVERAEGIRYVMHQPAKHPNNRCSYPTCHGNCRYNSTAPSCGMKKTKSTKCGTQIGLTNTAKTAQYSWLMPPLKTGSNGQSPPSTSCPMRDLPKTISCWTPAPVAVVAYAS